MYLKQIPSGKKVVKKISAALVSMSMFLGCQISALAASDVGIDGNAEVVISSYEVTHSAGVTASAKALGESQIEMTADFNIPGDWACYEFTVENTGSVDAVLSDVIQLDQTSEDILISFGIGKDDIGEDLKAGERCKISIVAQLDPEKTGSASAEGEFGLTMVYEAVEHGRDKDIQSGSTNEKITNGTQPKTGDEYSVWPIVCTMLAAAGVFVLAKKYRRI